MDIKKINENAWDNIANYDWKYGQVSSKEDVENARNGKFDVSLTIDKFVPRDWFFESFKGKKILALASAGGQQAPIFAALGADVTLLDISEEQLSRDEKINTEENLNIKIIQGDMTKLDEFPKEHFDLVFCPVSIVYLEELETLYQEVNRVLKCGAHFMLGTINPLVYLFDVSTYVEGKFNVVNKIPFSSYDELNEEELKEYLENGFPIEHSHSLESIIGDLLRCGFVIDKFYEDTDKEDKLCNYMNTYFALRAIKLKI